MVFVANTQMLTIQNNTELVGSQAAARMSAVPQFALLLPCAAEKNHPIDLSLKKRLSASIEVLKVPSVISYVFVSENAAPQLVQKPPHSGAYFVLSPIYTCSSPGLVIICSKGRSIWINGKLAPRVAIVREKDEILFDCVKLPVFVSLYRPIKVGVIPKSKIGDVCPICRQRFEKNSQVYICFCGLTMHSESTPCNEGRENLACTSLINKCLDCGQIIDLNSYNKFSFIPSNLV